jgi:3-dehydroquinate synthase
MSFTINSTNFTLLNEDISNNHLKIKSYNKVYDVIYDNKELSNFIKDTYSPNDYILIDRNVYNLDENCLMNIDKKNYSILDALESKKNMQTVLSITDHLYYINFTKKNKLIVIGGGITLDIGGFVAAMFKRGISLVYIPTTLLSITDSAIGSKVNVNRHSKNMLGLFYAPNTIYISDYFLKSLKEDDIISGLGESIKLCLIGGQETLKIFQDCYKIKDYNTIIKISSLIKKTVIEYDELEKNERKALNYGHECGHALESVTDYYIPHGIAVIFGMIIVNKLFDKNYNEIDDLMLSMIPEKFKKINVSYSEFIEHLLADKKNDGNNICFIVLDNIGKTEFIYKKLEEINEKLKEILEKFFTLTY